MLPSSFCFSLETFSFLLLFLTPRWRSSRSSSCDFATNVRSSSPAYPYLIPTSVKFFNSSYSDMISALCSHQHEQTTEISRVWAPKCHRVECSKDEGLNNKSTDLNIYYHKFEIADKSRQTEIYLSRLDMIR